MEIETIHKWRPVHTDYEWFLLHVLLLVLLRVCTEIKYFFTFPTLQLFLAVLCTLLLRLERQCKAKNLTDHKLHRGESSEKMKAPWESWPVTLPQKHSVQRKSQLSSLHSRSLNGKKCWWGTHSLYWKGQLCAQTCKWNTKDLACNNEDPMSHN